MKPIVFNDFGLNIEFQSDTSLIFNDIINFPIMIC